MNKLSSETRNFLINPFFSKETLEQIDAFLEMPVETCFILDLYLTGLTIRTFEYGTQVINDEGIVRDTCNFPSVDSISGHTHVKYVPTSYPTWYEPKYPEKYLYPSTEDIMSIINSDVKMVGYIFNGIGFWSIFNEAFYIDHIEEQRDYSYIINNELENIFVRNHYYKRTTIQDIHSYADQVNRYMEKLKKYTHRIIYIKFTEKS